MRKITKTGLMTINHQRGFTFLPILIAFVVGVAASVTATYIYDAAKKKGASAEVAATAGPARREDKKTGNLAATADTGVISGNLGANARTALTVQNPNPGNNNIGTSSTAGSFANPAYNSSGNIIESATNTWRAKTDGIVIFQQAALSPILFDSQESSNCCIEAYLGGSFSDQGQFDYFNSGVERISNDFLLSIDSSNNLISGGYTIEATPTSISLVDVRGILSMSDINISGRGYTINKNFSPVYFSAPLNNENNFSFGMQGTALAVPEPNILILFSVGLIMLAFRFHLIGLNFCAIASHASRRQLVVL
jgi:hypothetical protein